MTDGTTSTTRPADHTRGYSMSFVLAELALVLLTVAAIGSFHRVFVGDDWLPTLLIGAGVAHGLLIAVRRLGGGLLLALLGSAVALVATVVGTQYAATTRWWLPTGSTREAFAADMEEAWSLFGDVGTPTEPVTGFVVAGLIAVFVVAFLADWAAFRLWSTVEGFLPAGVLMVFVAIVGEERNRVALLAGFLGALMLFVVAHRVTKGSWGTPWLAGEERRGRASLLRTGAALALVAFAAAIAVGPQLPGADGAPIVDLEELDNTSSSSSGRVVVSPLVDIRGRLVDQENVEVFTVRSDQPAYWRLTSLDDFDGAVWTSRANYKSAEGTLPQDAPSGTSVEPSVQQYRITNLGAVWIPAAFQPQAVADVSDNRISYEPASSTLIVDRDLDSSNGLAYTVTSALPRFDPTVLSGLPADYPPELLEQYTALPETFSPRARALAEQIVADAGATTPYEQALALQDFFRNGDFVYDLEVSTGHASDRVEAFLFEDRRGYCEQFAGTFAALARHLGLPTRVAVGFTWGDVDPADPELYRVRGEHAHAWPEVFVPGAGWVAFEPTPGRGAPGATAHTGVEPMQDASGPSTEPIPLDEQPTPTPGPTTPSEDPFLFDDLQNQFDLFQPEAEATDPQGDQGGGTAVVASAIGLAVVALYAIGVPALKDARRRRLYRRAESNREHIGLAWTEATEALAQAGHPQRASETPTEYARRVRREADLGGRELTDLGQVAARAAYAPEPPDDTVRRAAVGWAGFLRRQMAERTSWAMRMLHRLDPRPLFRRR